MSGPDAMRDAPDPVVVAGVHKRFGEQVVHAGIDFTVPRGTLTALIGASGSGKSVLLREILGLVRPDAGSIRLLGADVWRDDAATLASVRRRIGMMFQDGALFSALSVGENVAAPILEHVRVPRDRVAPLVMLRLGLAGLGPETAVKMPSALSGGMRKRAAIARAIALEPEVLFLDEPTAGLDPATARGIDRLLRTLVDDLGMTVLVVTHDLDTLLGPVDRIVALADGTVIAAGDAQDVRADPHPWIRAFFETRRAAPGEPGGPHGIGSEVRLGR